MKQKEAAKEANVLSQELGNISSSGDKNLEFRVYQQGEGPGKCWRRNGKLKRD